MLTACSYVPQLYGKRAELKALKNLTPEARGALFPVVISRPRPNCNELSTASAELKLSADSRPFGLDVDRAMLGGWAKQPAGSQFDMLFDISNGNAKYYDYVKEFENAVPVLQLNDDDIDNYLDQLAHVHELQRGLVVRATDATFSRVLFALDNAPPDYHSTMVLLDAGWAKNTIRAEAWLNPAVAAITSRNSEVQIACVASTFPNSFAHIEQVDRFPLLERGMFQRIRRNYNDAVLVYGDWGSTRSPSEQKGGSPAPRIDLPGAQQWTCHRKSGDEGYVEVAARTTPHTSFLETPNCWGRQMVERTAQNSEDRIRGAETSTACRINIHLTVQAGSSAFDIADEPYFDPE